MGDFTEEVSVALLDERPKTTRQERTLGYRPERAERRGQGDLVVHAGGVAAGHEAVLVAELGRSVDRTPEAGRRLLKAKSVNPELGFVASFAAAPGYEVVLRRMSRTAQNDVAKPLQELASA